MFPNRHCIIKRRHCFWRPVSDIVHDKIGRPKSNARINRRYGRSSDDSRVEIGYSFNTGIRSLGIKPYAWKCKCNDGTKGNQFFHGEIDFVKFCGNCFLPFFNATKRKEWQVGREKWPYKFTCEKKSNASKTNVISCRLVTPLSNIRMPCIILLAFLG